MLGGEERAMFHVRSGPLIGCHRAEVVSVSHCHCLRMALGKALLLPELDYPDRAILRDLIDY